MRRVLCVLLAVFALPRPSGGQALPEVTLDTHITTTIATPIAITHAGDGSDRLFIVGRAGRIWVRPGGATSVLPTPFLDIDALVSTAGEGGLLGLAFDPDYARNGRFFVSYTDNANDSVVARYTVSADDPNRADPASATVLLYIDQGSSTHKAGDLHFGLDGYLYLVFGDGAEGFGLDDCGRAQSLTPADVLANDDDPDCTPDVGFPGNPAARALMGKLLRLDVSRSTPAGSNELCGAALDGSAPYAIPPANPFAGSLGGAGRCDEIFAYGLRNPFRFGVDRQTGDLFLGDVGESDMEEIDFIPAASPGAIDFGWPRCEGTLGDCGGSQAPILTDDRSAGSCSITGGRRYRGRIAALQGVYLYSDYCTGTVQLGREVAGSWSATPWISGGFGQHACFGEDEAGELYVCEINADKVRRFNAIDTLLFADGFETP